MSASPFCSKSEEVAAVARSMTSSTATTSMCHSSLPASIFVIDESQRGIVVQFGKVKRTGESDLPNVYEPGLHFKVPLIDDVRKLDARIQTLDGQADRFVTSEKKDLIIA